MRQTIQKPYVKAHDFKTCKNEACDLCDYMIHHGLITACDICDAVDYTEPQPGEEQKWVMLENGTILCKSCEYENYHSPEALFNENERLQKELNKLQDRVQCLESGMRILQTDVRALRDPQAVPRSVVASVIDTLWWDSVLREDLIECLLGGGGSPAVNRFIQQIPGRDKLEQALVTDPDFIDEISTAISKKSEEKRQLIQNSARAIRV